jgi:hypothetical protein
MDELIITQDQLISQIILGVYPLTKILYTRAVQPIIVRITIPQAIL